MLDMELDSGSQVLSTDNIQYKIEEAELYLNHGLYQEAENIFKNLLKDSEGALTPDLRQQIEQRLGSISSGKCPENGQESAEKSEVADDDKLQQDFESCLGLIEAGFLSEAIDDLKLLEKAGFKTGIVRVKIGKLYLKLDMPFDAIEYLEKGLEDPELPEDVRQEALYQLALTYERTGSVTKAVSTLETLVKLNSNFRNAKEKLESLNETAQKYGRFYYLIRNDLLQEEQLERAKEIARQSKKPIEAILINQFGIEKDEIGNSLSEYYRCPFIEFNELEVGTTPKCIAGIKEHFFRTTPCAPVKEEGNTLLVAVDNPHDLSKIDNIQRVLKAKNFEYGVALKEDIDKFIDYFFGKYNLDQGEDNVFEQLELVEEEEEDIEEDDSLASDADSVVVQMANKIIEDAFIRNASDIHVESLTGKRGALIRYRIDGDCLKYQTIPYNYKKALVSRIKIMASLDIAEKRLPQDGKIKFRTRSGKTIELRVATLPTTEGNEDVVLRILASSEAMPLDRIGLLEENLKNLKKCIEMPYGLILVVGPTGSGKTTTLHAALGHINRPEKKIWTAEDPVEIVQEGLRQVQIRSGIGLTFARVLRAFLRADPDVIMVGETRDEETANTVIEASLTGHMVFSTLHTNSAPETVTRLLGMGMDPFNFADALLCVLAQRLVKRLCPRCKEPYEPDDEEKERILYEFGKNPSKPLTDEDLEGVTLYRPKGCPSCNNMGYKGRMAIHELLVSDDGLRKLIQGKKPVMDIRDHGLNHGMTTLKQDGIRKVLLGETDMKQVLAACIR